MNFILLILLDISAFGDDSPCVLVARGPIETLIADWMRQREEIDLLRGRVAGQSPPSSHRSKSVPPDGNL